MVKLRKSLSQKALLSIVIVLLPVLIILFFLNNHHNKAYVKKHSIDEVTTIAGLYEGYIYQFLETAKVRTQDFASDGFIRSQLLKKIREEKKFSVHVLIKYLIKNKLSLCSDIKTVRILSLDGRVVASTNTSEIGKDLSRESFFKKGKDIISMTEDDTGDDELPELVISAPIFNKDTDKRIGVIANVIQTSRLNKILSGECIAELKAVRYNRIPWQTQDVYLVNHKKQLIIGAMSTKSTPGKLTIDTLPVHQGLTSNREMSGFYRNYDGIRVMGASVYIPSLRWILLVEITEDEVFAPLGYVVINTSVFVIFVVVMGIYLFVGFLRKVVRPLHVVSEATKRVVSGTSYAMIPMNTSDEIGVLCESFNNMAHDIKIRTHALEKSESDLAKTQKIALVGNWEWDIVSNSVYFSDMACSILDLNPQEYNVSYGLDFDGFLNLVHPDNRECIKKSINEALYEGKPYNVDFRVTLNDTTERYVHTTAKVIFDETEKAVKMVGTIHDVTRYRHMEEEAHLLQTMAIAISEVGDFLSILKVVLSSVCKYTNWTYGEAWLVSPDNKYLEYSTEWHRNPEELEKLQIRNKGLTFPPGAGLPGRVWLSKKSEWMLESVVNKNFPHAQFLREFGFKAAMGIPVITHDEVIAVLTFFVQEHRDEDVQLLRLISSIAIQLSTVIKRKQMKTLLREKEEKYRLLVENIPDVAWTADQEGNTIFIDPKVEKVYGYTSKEICKAGNHLWFGRIHPEDVEKIKDAYAMLFKANSIFDVEYRIRKKDETWMWMHNKAMIVYKKEGKMYTDGIFSDITKHKQMEDQLQKLSYAIEQSPNAVIITDVNGNIEYVNPKFTELTGYGKEEIVGKNPSILKSGNIPMDEYERMWYTISSGGKWRGEFLNKKKNDDLYWEVKNISPIKNKEGIITHFIGIAEDITIIKKAEELESRLREQLYHAQKLESVGTLAGGIAHDFNNILAIIIGYGNLLKKELGKNNSSIVYVQRILTSAERAVNLTRGLLTFSRKQQNNPKPIDINKIIKRVESLFIRLISEDIQSSTVLTDKDCIVMADDNQIEQVFVNLVTNARDAMPDGGYLTISTKIVELDEGFIRVYGYGEIGRYVLISVSDTGIGMDEETKKRIFEPFFTTKEVGKGTGLGLSIVYGIVKQHRGYINVDTEPDNGTTLNIYLPLIEAGTEAVKSEMGITEGGKETILLAEDEENVRKLTKIVLEKSGYKVIEAVNGEDAINKFIKYKDSVHFLILDVIMPTKDGKVAYDMIRLLKSNIKVLFISGYSEEVLNKKDILKEGLYFISKPVSPDELLRKVREILDK